MKPRLNPASRTAGGGAIVTVQHGGGAPLQVAAFAHTLTGVAACDGLSLTQSLTLRLAWAGRFLHALLSPSASTMVEHRILIHSGAVQTHILGFGIGSDPTHAERSAHAWKATSRSASACAR